jgi:1-acyl-sn-glycerol-3-phosphate acyltransferase
MAILYALLAIYALLFFGITLIIATLVYVFFFALTPKARAPHVAHGFSRIWAAVIMPMFFIRVRVQNKEIVDPKKTYVFVANHLSQLDIPVYALACKNTFRFLAKAELTKIPLLGFIIKRLYITVDRGDKNDRSKSIQAMKSSLDDNISVFLCPEGTRNRTKELLLPFKDGAFRLAIEAQKPIAVLTIFNSRERNSPTSPISLIPGTIDAKWEGIIETKGLGAGDVERIKDQAADMIRNSLIKYTSKREDK